MAVIDVDTHWETAHFSPGAHPLEPWLANLPTSGVERLAHGIAGDLLRALPAERRPDGRTLLPGLVRLAEERGGPVILHPKHDSSAAERVRWLAQHVEDVELLRGEGVDVRAVGVWAAFGMVDWHSLLRRRARVVEDGIYTFAGPNGTPEPTAVADALRALATTGRIDPGAGTGWWERADRVLSLDASIAMRDAGIPEGEHLHQSDEAYA